MRLLLAALAGTLLLTAKALAGTRSETSFAEPTPLSSNLELARRMLSPLKAAELPQALAQSAERLSAQPIDPASEKFVLYVPDRQPPHGYGLIVFVPPWDEPRVPQSWEPVLDQYGFAFVSAARSGNTMNALGRREPLAVLAAVDMARRVPIDPQRVYISGFSGGSRVAMRIALAYPDIFHGAILNSGADPVGSSSAPLPPKDLMLEFQSSSRLVYVTGSDDPFVLNDVTASMRSMRDWCQFNIESFPVPSGGHALIDGATLSRALDALARPIAPDAAKLAACRAAIDSDIAQKLGEVEQRNAHGDRDGARAELEEIDAHYGGLAAPRSVRMFRALGPR